MTTYGDAIERLTRERDAYARAKAENDERFQLEAATARQERDEARDANKTLSTENRRLRERVEQLTRYVAHLPSCDKDPLRAARPAEARCSCGLNRLLGLTSREN